MEKKDDFHAERSDFNGNLAERPLSDPSTYSIDRAHPFEYAQTHPQQLGRAPDKRVQLLLRPYMRLEEKRLRLDDIILSVHYGIEKYVRREWRLSAQARFGSLTFL